MEAAATMAPVFEAPLPARLEQLFDGAAAACGELLASSYSIAGRQARIRFAGREMNEALGRAFAHLSTDDTAEPELTIDVWDSATSGGFDPPLPAAHSDAAYGAKYYYGSSELQAHFQPASGALSVFDRRRNHAWYWFADPSALPDWERAASIRQILHWWLPRFGVFELHGGAIGTETGGVLLVGKGGSGKSTTALSSLDVPRMCYAGDDYVGVRLEPEPYAYSLYCSGKLVPSHAELLPHLAASNAGRFDVDDKAVFYVEELFPEKMSKGFPLRAVLLPTIKARKETRLVRVPPAVALAALAPSTLLQLHPPSPDGWAAMGKLVKSVPCFSLELGSEIDAIPRTILRYLERGEEERK